MKKMYEKFGIKICSCFLAVIMTFSLSITALANEQSVEESNNSTVIIITDDKNGNPIQYSIANNSTVDIPLYASKEGELSRALEKVATLQIGVGDGYVKFIFTPVNLAIGLLTTGFTGEVETYYQGMTYGYNYYTGVLRGTVSAGVNGIGHLSGMYYVAGYDPISVYDAFSW